MIPQFSREAKNRLLIGVNWLMVLICAAKFTFAPADLSNKMLTWLVVAPVILLLATVPVVKYGARLFHAGLFLITGASIGLTLGSAFSSPGALWVVEWPWLALAMAVAVVHYSPSSKDEYLG